MSDVPKIVLARLSTPSPGQHPDEDVLTAFSEQLLPPAERESVLQHLAQCGECREILALALPALESVVSLSAQAEEVTEPTVDSSGATMAGPSRWFAWPQLRWAGLAASIVVIASILLLRPGKSEPNTSREEPTEGKTALRQESSSAPPSQSPSNDVAGSPAVVGQITPSPKRNLARAPESPGSIGQLQSAPTSTRDRNLTALAKLSPGIAGRTSGTEVAPVPKGVATNEKEELSAGAPRPLAPPAETSPRLLTEMVTAEASSAEVTTADSKLSSTDALTAKNDRLDLSARNVPVERAKQPMMKATAAVPQETKTKKSVGESTNYAITSNSLLDAFGSNWQIRDGVLAHSTDAGLTWPTVLRADQPLLCHAERANEVWSGSKNGTVYYSANMGSTWTQLHPAANERGLTGDINAIALGKPGEVTLTTSTGETWVTMDNGHTWKKL